MRTWGLLAGVALLVAAVGGYFGGAARADVRAQDCEDWVDQTNTRVQLARSLLYPADREGAFEGTIEEAANELFILFEEQADSEPPEGAQQLNDDLIEAMSVGADALATGSGADAATQIVFTKSIVYNADARLLAVIDTC